MRTPDCSVHVVICRYSDGSGDPSILGVFEDADEAERLQNAVNEAGPAKTVEIFESYFYGS